MIYTVTVSASNYTVINILGHTAQPKEEAVGRLQQRGHDTGESD